MIFNINNVYLILNFAYKLFKAGYAFLYFIFSIFHLIFLCLLLIILLICAPVINFIFTFFEKTAPHIINFSVRQSVNDSVYTYINTSNATRNELSDDIFSADAVPKSSYDNRLKLYSLSGANFSSDSFRWQFCNYHHSLDISRYCCDISELADSRGNALNITHGILDNSDYSAFSAKLEPSDHDYLISINEGLYDRIRLFVALSYLFCYWRPCSNNNKEIPELQFIREGCKPIYLSLDFIHKCFAIIYDNKEGFRLKEKTSCIEYIFEKCKLGGLEDIVDASMSATFAVDWVFQHELSHILHGHLSDDADILYERFIEEHPHYSNFSSVYIHELVADFTATLRQAHALKSQYAFSSLQFREDGRPDFRNNVLARMGLFKARERFYNNNYRLEFNKAYWFGFSLACLFQAQPMSYRNRNSDEYPDVNLRLEFCRFAIISSFSHIGYPYHDYIPHFESGVAAALNSFAMQSCAFPYPYPSKFNYSLNGFCPPHEANGFLSNSDEVNGRRSCSLLWYRLDQFVEESQPQPEYDYEFATAEIPIFQLYKGEIGFPKLAENYSDYSRKLFELVTDYDEFTNSIHYPFLTGNSHAISEYETIEHDLYKASKIDRFRHFEELYALSWRSIAERLEQV